MRIKLRDRRVGARGIFTMQQKLVRSWQRVGVAMAMVLMTGLAWAGDVSVHGTLHVDKPGALVSRNVFGQFSEHLGKGIYGGLWVGPASSIPNTDGYRNDVMAALKALHVPDVRWPGGCFADEYHWRDGIGPRDKRPTRVNTHWGGVAESNAFGTQEFMNFIERIGSQAYVAGNVGDDAPQEMAQWVEYMTANPKESSLARERAANGHPKPWKVPYFGIGNELWGCGGNMRAEYAADLFRRYQTFVTVPPGQAIMKIAPGANNDDVHWTEVMMREAGKFMNGLSLHYYTVPGGWPPRASSTDFGDKGWIETLSLALHMDDLIKHHGAVMDKYDPDKKVALVVDEWGTWYAPLPGTNPGFLRQQNTLRDALVASLTLDIFTHHADRVGMANIAQMINVLQAMILTDGSRMLLTPTYHVFAMYRPYQDAIELPLQLETPRYTLDGYSVPEVHGSAVQAKDGHVYVALTNLDPEREAKVRINVDGLLAAGVGGQILTAPKITSRNTFDQPDAVKPVPFNGAQVHHDTLRVALPAKSIVMLQLH